VATAEKYEEILAVLDDLSYRDFQVLLILQRFETETPLEEQPCADPGVAKLYRATKFWEDFSDEVASETGIPSASPQGFLCIPLGAPRSSVASRPGWSPALPGKDLAQHVLRKCTSNEIPGVLERLTRTGLYQTNRALVSGYPGDKGSLTPNFAAFLKALGSAGKV
jgi:hypothetical protein